MQNPFASHRTVVLSKTKNGKPVLNKEGEPVKGTYLRPNIPEGGYTKGRADVQAVEWLFAECDNESIPRGEQTKKFLEVMPAATFSLWTGGKSEQHHWNVSPVSSDVGYALMLLLLRKCAFADSQVKCPSHLMRAPGSVHGFTGKPVEILTSTGKRYAVPELGLFPMDGGQGSGATRAAMEAAEYLHRREVPEEVIRRVVELHAWTKERSEPILNPAARGAAAKKGDIDPGAKLSNEPMSVADKVTRVQELVTQVIHEKGSPAVQRLKLRLLLEQEKLERIVPDQMATAFLSERTGPVSMEFEEEEDDVVEAEFTGPFVSGAFNLLVAAPKTGKTWLLAALVRKALEKKGRPLAGRPVIPVEHALFVSLDQGASPNKTMFRTMGLTVPGDDLDAKRKYIPGLSVGKRGTFAIEKVHAWAAAHPKGLIIVDSLSKIRPTVVSENQPEIGGFLSGLQGLAGEPTIILVHHAGKTAIREGRTRMDIIRGSGAIQGAVDWVAVLEAPLVRDHFGNWVPRKSSSERRICAEGRSLEPLEVYIDSRSYAPVPGHDFEDNTEAAVPVEAGVYLKDGENPTSKHAQNRKALCDNIVALIKGRPGEFDSARGVAKELGRAPTDKTICGLVVGMLEKGVIVEEGDGFALAAEEPGKGSSFDDIPEGREDQERLLRAVAMDPGGFLTPKEVLKGAGLRVSSENLALVADMVSARELHIVNDRFFAGQEDGLPTQEVLEL